MKIKEKPARNKQGDSLPLVHHAINGIEELKGIEVACLNLKKISNAPCDYFVICEGNSRTHVQAIARSVEEIVKKETGARPWHIEGLQNAEWVLMDYIDVVVHIFQPNFREHYGLENMWADGEIKQLTPKTPPEKITEPVVIKKKVAAKDAKTKSKKEIKSKAAVKKKAVKKAVKKAAKKSAPKKTVKKTKKKK